MTQPYGPSGAQPYQPAYGPSGPPTPLARGPLLIAAAVCWVIGALLHGVWYSGIGRGPRPTSPLLFAASWASGLLALLSSAFVAVVLVSALNKGSLRPRARSLGPLLGLGLGTMVASFLLNLAMGSVLSALLRPNRDFGSSALYSMLVRAQSLLFEVGTLLVAWAIVLVIGLRVSARGDAARSGAGGEQSPPGTPHCAPGQPWEGRPAPPLGTHRPDGAYGQWPPSSFDR